MIVDKTNYMLKVICLYDLDNTLVRSDEKLLYFYEKFILPLIVVIQLIYRDIMDMISKFGNDWTKTKLFIAIFIFPYLKSC